MQTLNRFREILVTRLEQKGIAQHLIPGILRMLAIFLIQDPDMNLSEVNKRLKYIGWDGFEMDYHTLQLAIAYITDTHYVHFANYQTIN